MKKYLQIKFLSTCYLIVILFLTGFQHLKAQSIGNYVASRTTGISYTSIESTGNSFVSWRSNTGPYTVDDNRSDLTEIGFDFWYNGNRYDEFSVSTNGFIDFSSSTANGDGGSAYGFVNSLFNQAGGTTLALAPFYDDLTSQNAVDPLGSSLKYITTGFRPNRVLTIEWIDMAVYGNTSPSLNFQIKLYETSNIIDFIYGNMLNAGFGFTYTTGINASVLSATPSASQLSVMQTANTTTFSQNPVSNLSTMPTTNSRLRFVSTESFPATSGSLALSSITSNTMNLSWTDWCSNETTFALYYSTDGVNYEFETRLPANSTSYLANELDPGTIYYWNLYALVEGYLSNALVANATTISAGSKSTAGSGSWKNPLMWTPTGVPTSGDDVLIKDGDVITIDTIAKCFNLTIGGGVSGSLLMGNSTVSRELTVGRDIIINASARIEQNSFNAIHNLIVKGNFTNNGILDIYKSSTRNTITTFTKLGSRAISGTGITTNFGKIVLNKGTSISNVLTVNSTNFTAPVSFLTLEKGTFRYAVTTTQDITPFNVFDTIPRKTQFQMSSNSSTATFNGGISLFGNLTLDTGIVNIGTLANENLRSDGGFVILNRGKLNVAGSYFSLTQNTLSNYVQYAGTMTVASVGTTSTINAPFHIQANGSSFRMIGGTILINREGGTGAQDLGYTNLNATYLISGGTLQMGGTSTPTGQTMRINTTIPIFNLTTLSANGTTDLLSNLTVSNNFNQTLGAFRLVSYTMNVGGNWIHPAGTFTPGTGRVIFNGSLAQTITRSSNETFSNLEVANKSSLTLTSTNGITVTNSFNLNSGNFVIGSTTLVLNGTVSGTGKLEGSATSNLTIGGTGILGVLRFENSSRIRKTLLNLTLNKTGGSGEASIDGSDSLLVLGTVTLTSGILNTSNKLVLISTSTATARVAALPAAGAFSGNVIVQRFVPARPDRRNRLVSSPVNTTGTAITIAQLIDDVNISGSAGATNGFDNTSLNRPSIYTYNESVAGSYNFGYVGAPTINTPIATGQGMFVQVRGNRNSPTLASPAFYTAPFPLQTQVTVDFEGTINRGAISPVLSYTNTGSLVNDGYNLVGNPYPSQIDWKSASWTRTNLDAAMYIYNPLTNSYGTYLHTSGLDNGTNGVGRYISSSQGFFVKANAANPVLTFQEAVKSTATPNQVFRTAAEEIAKINLIKDSANQDEIIIGFDSLYSITYLESEDAGKFLNQTINLSSRNSGNAELAINSRPHLQNGDTIFLSVDASSNGAYNLNFENFATLAPGLSIYLKDEFTNTNTDLRTISSYSFFISSDINSKGKLRFKIITEIGAPLPVQLVSFTCRKEGKNALVTWSSFSEINFSNYELEKTDGVKPFSTIAIINGKNGISQNHYSHTDLSTFKGLNYYRLKFKDVNGKFSYSKVVSISFDDKYIFAASIYPIPAQDEITISLSNAIAKTYQLTIRDVLGQLVIQKDIQAENGNSFKQNINELAQGSYVLTVAAGDNRISTNFIKK